MKNSSDTVRKLVLMELMLHFICTELENMAGIVCISLSVGEQKEE